MNRRDAIIAVLASATILPVLLHSRIKDGRPRETLDALSAAFKSAVRG